MIDNPADHRPGSSSLPSWLTPGTVAIAATLLGAALRFYKLDAQALWLDEISSLRNAVAFGSGGLDALARSDQVAPLHSITLWLATVLGGDSAISLRMPSVLAGICLIPLMYGLGVRLLGSAWTGAVAALLVAISPYEIWYSQEARMYALLLLSSAGAVFLAWPVTYRPLRPWELAAVAIVTAIGFGMHHYMALSCGAFGLFLLVRGQALKPRAWAWLATQVAAFLLFAGWLYLTRDRLGNVAGTEKPSFALWIPYTFFTYIAGFSFGPSTRDIQQGGGALKQVILPYAPVIALLGASSLALLAAGLWRSWRRDMRVAGQWLLIWLIAPILIAVIATRVTNIRYNVRYVIVCYPALILLLALGIGQVRAWLGERRMAPALIGTAAVLVMVGCMIASDIHHYADDRYAKEDVRSLAAALDRLPPDAAIVSDNNRVVKVLRYYHGRLPGEDIQVDYRTERLSVERVWENFLALPPGRRRDVALIEYRSWETDPDGVLRGRLGAMARPVWSASFPGASVTLFRAGPSPENGTTE